MYTSLGLGPLGIRATLQEGLALAQATGFEGLDVDIEEAAKIVKRHGADYVLELFRQHGLRPGYWDPPIEFRQDEATWKAGLKKLPRLARTAQKLGCPRTATWIVPFSDERTSAENMAFHVARLRPIAEILAEHDCVLGLEYVGPASLRAGHTHEFIHDLAGWRELCAAIDMPNLGLLLDAYHWYTSGGTEEELLTLRDEEIVLVHMNDGIAGVPRDEQLDLVRSLPGESGVIDLSTFLRALQRIGYTGPLTVEPFSDRIRAMAPLDAARETFQALQGVMIQAGVR